MFITEASDSVASTLAAAGALVAADDEDGADEGRGEEGTGDGDAGMGEIGRSASVDSSASACFFFVPFFFVVVAALDSEPVRSSEGAKLRLGFKAPSSPS